MAIAASNALTVEDLEALPDDGRRYELIGGAIVMTPAPIPGHQTFLLELAVVLRREVPPGHKLFITPIDYDLPDGHRVQPDVIIVPVESIGEKRLAGPALLIVEIVSPGSNVHDRITKRAVYEEAGVPAYWIIDPAAGHFLALRLSENGTYGPYVDTDGPVTVDWPVAVSFGVAELAAR